MSPIQSLQYKASLVNEVQCYTEKYTFFHLKGKKLSHISIAIMGESIFPPKNKNLVNAEKDKKPT